MDSVILGISIDRRLEYSPAGKDLRALVDGKINKSQQCGLAPKKGPTAL